MSIERLKTQKNAYDVCGQEEKFFSFFDEVVYLDESSRPISGNESLEQDRIIYILSA